MPDPEEQHSAIIKDLLSGPPKQKEVIAEKVTGTVKWFNVKCSYGFINRNDTKEDVFVHQSAIVKNNPRKYVRSVGDGESVEFDVVIGEKGHEAANVTGPGGRPVQGSVYAADRRPWRRRAKNFFARPEENRESSVDGGEGGLAPARGRGRGSRRARGRVSTMYRGGMSRISRGGGMRGRGEGRGRGRRGRGYAPRNYYDYRGGYRGRGRFRGGPPRRDYDYEDDDDEERQEVPSGRGRRGARRFYGRSFYGRGRGRGRGYGRAKEDSEQEQRDEKEEQPGGQENGGTTGKRRYNRRRSRSQRDSQKNDASGGEQDPPSNEAERQYEEDGDETEVGHAYQDNNTSKNESSAIGDN